MRKFTAFILLCCLAAPVWAAPSLLDVNSWQLPEEPAEPVVAEQPASVAKPKKSKKVKVPELKVQMTEGNQYSVATSTRDITDIDIMNKSAKELINTLAGRDRFHILFNANLPVTFDTVMTSADDKEYAVALFGDEEQDHYRLLVFKNDVEQPLIATAQDVRGKLDIFSKYQLDTNITEAEIKRTFPDITPQQFVGKEDQEQYTSYQLEGPLFVLFKSGKVAKSFTDEKDFTEYVNQLKGPAPQQTPDQAPQADVQQPAIAQQPATPQKRKFSEIVYGPGYNHWGNEDPYFHHANRPGDLPPGTGMELMQPDFDPLNPQPFHMETDRRRPGQRGRPSQQMQPGQAVEQTPEEQTPAEQKPAKYSKSTIRR